MGVCLYRQVLHVMAGRAETPVFRLCQIHVDLVHLHAPLVGIEAVLGRKLREGRLRRALVLLRSQRHVGTLPRLIRGTLAP